MMPTTTTATSTGATSTSAEAGDCGGEVEDHQIHENIPGMGGFYLRRYKSQPPFITTIMTTTTSGGGRKRPLPQFDELEKGQKEELIKLAYELAAAICNCFYPGESGDMMNALADSHKILR